MIIPKGTVVTIDGKVYRTLEAQVAWNKKELESLDIEALEALPDQFTELQENVSALGDSVADVVEDVGDLESDMSDAQSDISGLKDRMDSAETNIGLNAGEITQLQFDLGQAQGDITSLGNSKLDKPTNEGETGDVIVKTANGTEYQSVAPFNPNGTYPNVTAGKAISAKSLENVSEDSGAEQDEPFFFQATATANNTAETPTAPTFELKALRGNTIVYNQLVEGVSSTYPTISGHVYWFKHDPLVTLVTSTGTDINVPTPQDDLLVDLTRWFNGNIPQAILDDPTVFPINYYDDELTYSAGELKNCSCTELTTVGFNAFDVATHPFENKDRTGANTSYNVWEQGFIPVIPNAVYGLYHGTISVEEQYVAFYTEEDETTLISGESISEYSSNNFTFTIPQNAKFIRFGFYSSATLTASYIANANPFVFLYWDGERTDYEPYISHTYPMVWSGKSAGETYDEKLPDGTEIANVIQYSVPSQNVSAINASAGIYDVRVYDAFLPANNLERVRFVACNYFAPATSISTSNMTDLSVMIAEDSGSALIIFRDSSCTTTASFIAKYPNIIVNYRAKTPTTSSGDPFTSVIEGDDYGTMEFDSVVPVGNEFFYPADYALLIDDLNNYVNGDVTELAKKSDLIPAPTGGDGTYVFKATVSGGTVTYFWEAES